MEVFGVFSGAVSCIDVGVRVSEGLAKLIEETKNADTNAKYLQDKVTNICHLLENVREILGRIASTQKTAEAVRIRNQIFKAIEHCQETLIGFDSDLSKHNGQQRFELLRKALLARRLQRLSTTLKRFEGNLETHWKSISILFQCLQIYSSNFNNEILHKLCAGIEDGNIYLQRHAQEDHIFQPPSRTRTSISQATTVLAEDEESTDHVFGKEEKGHGLKTLSDSISVAQKVYNRISRPGSSRESIIDKVDLDEEPKLASTDPNPKFAVTLPLVVLNRLTENLSKLVANALLNDNLADAEKHQRSLIEYLQQRRNVYDRAFDENKVLETLADIYGRQGRWQDHEVIYRQLLKKVNASVSSDAQSQSTESSLKMEILGCQSRLYKSLAESLFNQCPIPEGSTRLEEAAAMAWKSVMLKIKILQEPDKPNADFGDAVRQLIKILQRVGDTVEADTLHQEYSIHLESGPLSPPLTPVPSIPSTSSSARKTSTSRRSIDHNALDKGGFTPLVLAIHQHQVWQIYDLLEKGADAEMACKGKTPFMHAIQECLPGAVRALRENHSNLDMEERDSKGRTALCIAAEYGDCKMIETLLDLGANIEVASTDRRTPLMYAARSGHASAVETLLHLGHNCHSTDSDGMNSLHHAVHRFGGRKVIERLIAAGIGVNSRCEYSGETALHIAVKLCDKDLIRQENLEALLANGADINLEDGAENTPVSVAVENELEDVAELFLEQGATYDRKPPPDVDGNRNIKKLLERYNQRWDPEKRPVSRRDDSGTMVSTKKYLTWWRR